MDALIGDAALFTRDDEVEAEWGLITPDFGALGQDPRPGTAELRRWKLGTGSRRQNGDGFGPQSGGTDRSGAI